MIEIETTSASSHGEGPKTFAATSDEATPSDVDEVDDFASIIDKGRKMARKSKRKEVQISIPSAPNKKDATMSEGLVAPPVTVTANFEQNDLIPDGDIHGDLSFFSETHEGKGPDSKETQSPRGKKSLPVELEKMEKNKVEDMAQINTYLVAKWEDRTEILNKQVSKIRQDMLVKQKTQRAQLAEKHRTQQELDKRKIDEGRKWLLERQQQQLRQEAEQTGKAGTAIMEEWSNISAQLQTRHAYQLKQFEVKEATMKERSANDANAQNQILEAHHKKRCAEAEAFIEDLIKKCQQKQKNLKAKLTRLHEQRFEAKKRKIQIEFAKPLDTSVSEEKSVDPHSPQELGNDLDSSSAHTAVMRHKRRKHIMNGTTVQVAVDIHNEGLFLMARSTHENESLSRFGNVSNTGPGVGTIVTDDISGRPCLFIPWGSKARSFLYSIVCGEIPPGYGLEKVTAGSTSNQKLLDGGLVKCMVTDTRTSQETAISDRAQSYPKIQKMSNTTRIENAAKLVASYSTRIKELESDINTLSFREQKIAQAHRDATQHLERSKATMDKLKLHLQQFFGKDGTPSPNLLNPEGQQKILSTMYKYKTSYEAKRNEESALREPLEFARKVLVSKKDELEKVKQEIQKLDAFKKEVNSKSGMEVNMIDKRAENLINSICQVAQRRRAQVNLKKSNSDPMHDIPEEEKKSFAQKMTRRRIVTMLRPTQVSIVNEVKDMVGKSPEDANIDPKLRAEELLLLSLYPQAEEALAPVPSSTNKNWAEPGWKLDLSPPEGDNPHSILPLDQVSHLPRQNLSVCCSSGRQTASLVQQRHLRMLEGPLSFVSKASAPAEMNQGQHRKIDDAVTSDPLSITEDDMRLGYSFVLRPPKNIRSKTKEIEQKSPTKRKTTNVDDDTSKKEAKAKRQSQSQAGEASPKTSQSVGSGAPLQQPAPVGTSPLLMQQNQPMQQPKQPIQQSNQPMQNQPMQLQNHMQPLNQPMQLQNPTQQSNQQQNIMQQQNQNVSMQHQNQNMPIQQNQSVALPNNNVVNRNQSFMSMNPSPEQYQWMLQQQQIRLQQQQQQIQLQQFQNQQQMQQHRQQPQNQGQSNNASHSHQQQNTRR